MATPPPGTENGSSGTSGTSNQNSDNEDVSPPVQYSGVPLFNPPLISFASGSWKPLEGEPSPPKDRSRIVGPSSETLRVRQRGVIIQDLTHANDWTVQQEFQEESSGEPGALNSIWQKVVGGGKDVSTGDADEENSPTWWGQTVDEVTSGTTDPWKKGQSLLSGGKTYGFRFHYNPSTISMGVGVSKNVNPALVISGRDTFQPFAGGDNPGAINITIYLNRIEDFTYLRQDSNGQFRLRPSAPANLYEGRTPNQAELRGIATRGTEYDLEFLFRTIMGRPFPTVLRGNTANLGMIWGTPCQLWLSRTMRFRGRVGGIQWSHRSFNRFMTPLWTEVSLSFLRYPDAVRMDENIQMTDGYANSRVMGYDINAVWENLRDAAGVSQNDNSGDNS